MSKSNYRHYTLCMPDGVIEYETLRGSVVLITFDNGQDRRSWEGRKAGWYLRDLSVPDNVANAVALRDWQPVA